MTDLTERVATVFFWRGHAGQWVRTPYTDPLWACSPVDEAMRRMAKGEPVLVCAEDAVAVDVWLSAQASA